jgi:inosine-uridine nucleoside N-ribohydrolase
MVHEGTLISTREVWTELKGQDVSEQVLEWGKRNKKIFSMPDRSEMMFVATIFNVPHFQSLIGEQQRLKGMPVADPFVIACAKSEMGQW